MYPNSSKLTKNSLISCLATYILFIPLSSCQVKLKCWPQETKSLSGLPNGSDRLETKWCKKSWTNLVCTNCVFFLLWGHIKRLCFSGGVTVVLLVDKGSLTFLISFFYPAHVLYIQWIPPFCVLTIIMSLRQAHNSLVYVSNKSCAE